MLNEMETDTMLKFLGNVYCLFMETWRIHCTFYLEIEECEQQ